MSLITSDNDFYVLANAIPQLAWMADAEGSIFWYNTRWFEFTGTRPEQMNGTGWQSVHDPRALPKVLESWKACIATGEGFEMEFPLRRGDGVFLMFLTRVTPLKRNGRVVRWFGTNTDISERAEAEIASAHLAAIVESSEDAIIGKDLEGKVKSWNRAAERLYGYSRAEAIGMSMNVLLPPERADEERDILQQIRKGERVKSIETSRMRKGGQTVLVSLTVSPIRNKDGEITGASHTAHDITERKEFEAKMQEMQKLESLGVLAGGIAHDFNNLLTGIIGNADLALSCLPEGDEGRRFLEHVVMASERAATLTKQLLAYACRSQVAMSAINLSKLTEELTQLIEASIPRKVDLALKLDPDLPLIQGDEGQIQQVIMNLVINGAEAVGEQGGTVTVRTWLQHVDAGYLRSAFSDSGLQPGQYAVLEVSDNGCGMDQALMSKIFDPFFTTKFAGRGLGLASVLGIVRTHGGALKVESVRGAGTTFRVLFPTTTFPAIVLPPKEVRRDSLRGNGHILVVEDEAVIRNFVSGVLKRYGYSATLARNGREGVELFSRAPQSFRLVLLDLTMPEMNGDEAFRRIQSIRPGVPVLLMSGYLSNTATTKFAEDGLVGFIQKPFTVAELAEKLQTVLSPAVLEPVN